MKIAISFVCGALICYLMILGLRPLVPVAADDTSGGGDSSNTTSVLQLLPNFDKIYRNALAEPFVKAESKIKDPDIADYYRDLMDKTGLTNPNGE